MPIQSFKDLIVWQRGIQLVISTYDIIQLLPNWEGYDLASQMRRAAVSVPSNIAEGHERGSRRDYAHFLTTSRGSLAELETLFTVAEVVRHVKTPQLTTARRQAEEVSRMIWGIQRGLARK